MPPSQIELVAELAARWDHGDRAAIMTVRVADFEAGRPPHPLDE